MNAPQLSNTAPFNLIQETVQESELQGLPAESRNEQKGIRFAELIAVTFPNGAEEQSSVVAFTAAEPKAGVTVAAASVAKELAGVTNRNVLLITAQALDLLRGESLESIRKLLSIEAGENLLSIEAADVPAKLRIFSRHRKKTVEEVIALLRVDFGCVLIDMPAVSSSDLALQYASAVDSIVLVVVSGSTSERAVSLACRRLTAAKGRVAGLICNKRRYTIPGWIYNRI